MWKRLRALATIVVLLCIGILGGSAIAQWRDRSPGAPAGPAAGARAQSRVRVEVLNGGGRAGAAREVTEQLRGLGFDVVFFGNAEHFGADSSVVLDRVGAMEGARAVADALGIGNVRSEPDSNLYLDVSVVLGTDWTPAAAKAGPGDRARPRAWWDPRGWLRR